MDELTPMFRQFYDVKAKCPDAILFFRVGDFYETYGEDAEITSKELGITLTSKEINNKRIPMAGVPFHAVEPYLHKMIKKGYKVAIGEQLEDPKKAKGLVKRDIVRIITSGTVLEDRLLEDKQNNYLLSVVFGENGQGIAYADISTGKFSVSFIEDSSFEVLKSEIARLKPAESILCDMSNDDIMLFLKDNSSLTLKPQEYFDLNICREKILNHFGANSISNSIFKEHKEVIQACGSIIRYLEDNHNIILASMARIDCYDISDYMGLDHRTRKNLELTSSIRDGKKYGTLLWILDKTKTSMGGRKLRQWIEQPLMKISEIKERLDAVEEFYNSFSFRETLREKLKEIRDIERLFMKIAYGTASGRDLISVKNSLESLPIIKELLSASSIKLIKKLANQIHLLEEVKILIETSIDDDPPFSIKEGNIIKKGFNKEVDELRTHRFDGKQWIAELENKERERTGIKSLKVRYNKVFGYFIEVTKPNLHLIPEDYIRKQTIVTGERFIIPPLKDYEAKVMGAAERLKELEYELFCTVRAKISEFSSCALQTADAIATADVILSLAEVALANSYIKPEINKSSKIILKESRHPVIEEILEKAKFVPNDVYMDCSSDRLLIVTGPNMAGKSTYLRQVALCVIMAQMGSFIPAQQGSSIGIVDRIFTRIGAFDDLVMGQSTFLVEMKEIADILSNSTEKSLIILDEIGRGTSTYDGLSIALAVAEYIYEIIKAKTLFTTHFHELTQMSRNFPGIKNYRVAVKEKGKEIIFLRKIFPGSTDRSYGVKVARLAGLPEKLLDRAENILQNMEKEDNIIYNQKVPSFQMEFFQSLPNPLIDEIRYIDIDKMTPVEALVKISELKNRVERQYV